MFSNQPPILYIFLHAGKLILNSYQVSLTSEKQATCNNFLMKSQIGNRFTLQSSNDHQTYENSKLSRASFSSEQVKLYEYGLYFPDKILYTTQIDVKTVGQQWLQNKPIKLTSLAFGDIPICSITKIKYYQPKESNKLVLKISTSQNSFFNVDKEEAVEILRMISWSKLATMNIFANNQDIFPGKIEGEVYKKSQVLKNWEKRYISISGSKGLESWKKKDSLPSLKITKTNELWTRFETIKNNQFLVIKLWYGIMKQQFAVPVQRATLWIQAFCSLLS